MDVLSLGPLPVASLVWQPAPGRYVLTVVCKATFNLAPVTSELAADQEAPNEDDNHWDDDPARSLYSPSDLAPFKLRADILLVGHAFAPRGEPVRSLVARLLVGELDKSIEVFGDRAFTRQGGMREIPRFTKMPLRYERAAGGPGTKNPVGVRSDATDPYGAALFPNLQPVGLSVTNPGDYIEPVGFGPIAPTWRDRMERLGPHAAAFTPDSVRRRPLPEGFDGTYFNAAPRDQQVDGIRSGERLVLEHLHWDHARLVTSLRGVYPQAFAETSTAPPAEIPLVCDTLWIDTDRALCTLTWRGQLPLQHPAQEGRVLVAVAPPGATQRLSYADVARLRGEVSSAARGPSSSPARPPPLPARQGAVEIVEPKTFSDDARDVTASPDDLARFRAAMPFFDPKGPMTPVPMPPIPPASPRPPSPPRRGTGTAPGTSSVPSSITGVPSSSPAPPAFVANRPAAPPPLAPLAPPPMPAPVMASPPLPPAPPPIPPSAIAPAPLPIPPSARAPAPESASPRAPSKSDEWLTSSPMPPSPAAGGGAVSTAAAAQSGAAAASTAAAAASASPAPARAPSAKSQPSAPSAQRSDARELLDLLWFDPDSVRRMRSYKPWKAALSEAANEWLDPSQTAKSASKPSERADALRVLLKVKPLDGDGIVASMASSIDEDSAFTPPLVVVSGELHFPFDDTEILKAYVAGATPFLGPDKKLREIVDTASEVLRSPWPGSRGLVESLASRLKEAFAQANRALPPAYLETSAEQVLLEQRRYQKRTILGQDRIRGLITLQGGGAPVPTYLPDSLTKQLPMFQRFRAVITAEAYGQQDQYESHAVALVGLALARVLPIPTIQSR